MPQLDKVTFFNQIFYLLLFFFLLYLFVLKYILPTVAATLKVRNMLLAKGITSFARDTNKDFRGNFIGIFEDYIKVSKHFVSSVNLDLLKSFKVLSSFLFFNKRFLSLQEDFFKKDINLNKFRFDKSSPAARRREKQRLDLLQQDQARRAREREREKLRNSKR